MANLAQSQSKFKISRRGRKLHLSDDQRTLVALPRDVPERTWSLTFIKTGNSYQELPGNIIFYVFQHGRAEILQKEENELLVFDIREEIVETALKIVYVDYMEKQTAVFSVYCATEAWLKLINWHFYRHDPGEETSAYPPCYIPKREESWIPDERPAPSPKDTWGKHSLHVVEDTPDAVLQKWPSSSSLDLPVIEEIPSEYWFPGKINVPPHMQRQKVRYDDSYSGSRATSEGLNTESEVLQKITDYSTEGLSEKESSSTFGELKTTTPVCVEESVQGPLHGAGDSSVTVRPKKRITDKSKSSFIKPGGKSKAFLPPLVLGDSRSRISIISDCRLRNLRLETQYEITSEKVDTPPGEITKRK